MNEKKDFKYEAQEPVIVNNDTKEIEPSVGGSEYQIHDVQFLVSAVVDVGFGSMSSKKIEVNIDLANRKVWIDGKLAEKDFADAIFEHLDRVNSLPEDFFEASEDIYEKANKAVDEMEDIRKSTLGEE